MMNFDVKELRRAFGTYMTGVTVVTALNDEGVPVGFTANSFTSVSMDPPMLLICPGRNLSSFDVFSNTGRFAVSILAEGQEDVSNTFARSKGDRFNESSWTPDKHGCPLIDGAAATFSCEVNKTIEAGDHIILLGSIDAYSVTERNGLGYMNGNYFSLGLEQKADRHLEADEEALAGALVVQDDNILVVQTPDGIKLPMVEIDQHGDMRLSIKSYLKSSGFDSELGAVYSIFEDKQSNASYTYFLAADKNSAAGQLGEFISINQLPNANFVYQTESVMLKRFAEEYKNQRYNLYVGDEARGKLHKI